jgi:hypothetical protein
MTDPRAFTIALAVLGRCTPTLHRQLENRPVWYSETKGDPWPWLRGTGADLAMTLAPDAQVAPHFWMALRAMAANLPLRSTIVLDGMRAMWAQDIGKPCEVWTPKIAIVGRGPVRPFASFMGGGLTSVAFWKKQRARLTG